MYIGQLGLTIDGLPDDVLLAIFDFYVVRYQDLGLHEAAFRMHHLKGLIQSWQSLVQVCRRWRGLVFSSPRRLNTHLCYDIGRSARNINTLDVWPAIPLLIHGDVHETSVDNVIAVFEHSDRIHRVDLRFDTTLKIEKLYTAMQVPFPELTIAILRPSLKVLHVPVLPDSFLGGSAPRLRYFSLISIPFPGLPNLLLSTTHLVRLDLYKIPHSGYISPDAMATCLSMSASLESLNLEFQSPRSSPDPENRPPPSPTRSVLPALKVFWFRGTKEYLEDLVSRIDAPRLHQLFPTFFNDIDFNIPELNQFISRTPTLRGYDEARLIFGIGNALVSLQFHPKLSGRRRNVDVKILCQVPDWQISSLAQVCTMSSHLVLTTENLFIYEGSNPLPDWEDGIENTEWLDLLLPFVAVKNLYISKAFLSRIAPALRELTGGRTTEVLPALENVLLEEFEPSEPVEEGIAQFISARQLTNRPVTISVWVRLADWK